MEGHLVAISDTRTLVRGRQRSKSLKSLLTRVYCDTLPQDTCLDAAAILEVTRKLEVLGPQWPPLLAEKKVSSVRRGRSRRAARTVKIRQANYECPRAMIEQVNEPGLPPRLWASPSFISLTWRSPARP